MSSLADAVRSALIHSIWQNAVIWSVLWVALACVRRSPTIRYLLGCLALALMTLWPVMTAWQALVAVAPPEVVTSTNTAPIQIVVSQIQKSLPGVAWSWTPTVSLVTVAQRWALPCWIAGALFCSLRLMSAARHTHALTRRSIAADTDVANHVIALARRLGVRRPLRILIAPVEEGLATLGWIRPVILVPAASLAHITPPQLEALLAHELAHVRRYDYLVNTTQMFIETLFFYHPAVWWTSNRIRTERELCCDDVAVAVCGDSQSYAEALTAAAQLQLTTGGSIVHATRWTLLPRIQRLLTPAVVDLEPSPWPLVVALGLVIVGGSLNLNWARGEDAAQRPQGATFEVASIKRNVDPNVQLGIRPINNGARFSAVVTVKMLINVAYGNDVALLDSQIVGGPSWIDQDQFEINATPDGPIAQSPDGPPVRLLSMVQALLADRFQLRVHRETRQQPIYELVLDRADGRPGPGLRLPDGQCVRAGFNSTGPIDFSRSCGLRSAGAGGFAGRAVTLGTLAQRLGFLADVQRMVLDRTGVTSAFDLDLEFTPFGASPAADAPPTIFTALKEQLGLQLRPAIGPVEVLVIDRVEPPTPD